MEQTFKTSYRTQFLASVYAHQQAKKHGIRWTVFKDRRSVSDEPWRVFPLTITRIVFDPTKGV
jgi:hypothetical protein